MSSLFACLLASCLLVAQATIAIENVDVPNSLRKNLKSFEPSGAVYLPALNLYLISSDDTDKKDSPWLFLMNEQGQVDATPLEIKGVQAMTDMESMSLMDDGTLYILSSLGINKNNKSLPERNHLVRARVQGRGIQAEESVELRSLLLNAIKSSPIPELMQVRNRVDYELDVESHFILNGEFYVGLKNPQVRPGQALILNLGRVDDIFANQKISQISLWQNLDFGKISKKATLLSEMLIVRDELFVTTSSESGNGALWTWNLGTQTLKLIKEFTGSKSEGLAYRPRENDLMVFFDQGAGPAQYQLIPNIL